MREIRTKVRGISHRNGDGTRRQKIVRQCRCGQQLRLIREPDNRYDQNAIAVYVGHSQLGYVSRDLASDLAPIIDDGGSAAAEVLQVTGGGWFRHYGLNIVIEVKGHAHRREHPHNRVSVFGRILRVIKFFVLLLFLLFVTLVCLVAWESWKH